MMVSNQPRIGITGVLTLYRSKSETKQPLSIYLATWGWRG